MNQLPEPIRWLFTPPPSPTAGQIFLWWEARRIPINLLIGGYGIICLLIYSVAINCSGVLQPGEDAVNPFAIVLGMIAFNVCYTLGWIVEIPTRGIDPSLHPKLGVRLLLAGVIFSFCIISLAAIYWAGYVILQLARFIK